MAKKSGKLASRYARALLASVEKELGVSGSPTPAQKIAAELQQFSTIWKNDQELSNVLLSPMFAREQRTAALESVVKEAGLTEVTRKFLKVVFLRDRIAALPEIAEAFSVVADRAASVVRVTVSTAREIDKVEAEGIEKAVAGKVGGSPEFTWNIDPKLLGGLVIEYAGQIFDGSLSGQLGKIEKELTP